MSKIIKNHPYFKLVKIKNPIKNPIEETCLYFIKVDVEIYGKITKETIKLCEIQKFKIPENFLNKI